MKTFSRGFVLSALAAGALTAGMIKLAAADSYGASAPVPAASPFVVTIKDFSFSPSQLTVPLGATVVWKNLDSVAHTATSSAKGFDSGNLDNGKSYSFTFSKAGSYAYVCSYHPSMTGVIVVQAPSSPSP